MPGWPRARQSLRRGCSTSRASRPRTGALRKMLCEPEFLKAEARKEGERRIADATMKHWASKAMVMSFADSLGTAENCVPLEIGDDEFGRFLVTVQRRQGKSPLELLDEMQDRLRTMEIALEAMPSLSRSGRLTGRSSSAGSRG